MWYARALLLPTAADHRCAACRSGGFVHRQRKVSTQYVYTEPRVFFAFFFLLFGLLFSLLPAEVSEKRK